MQCSTKECCTICNCNRIPVRPAPQVKYRAAKEYSEAALQAASRSGGISAADRAYQARTTILCLFRRWAPLSAPLGTTLCTSLGLAAFHPHHWSFESVSRALQARRMVPALSLATHICERWVFRLMLEFLEAPLQRLTACSVMAV